MERLSKALPSSNRYARLLVLPSAIMQYREKEGTVLTVWHQGQNLLLWKACKIVIQTLNKCNSCVVSTCTDFDVKHCFYSGTSFTAMVPAHEPERPGIPCIHPPSVDYCLRNPLSLAAPHCRIVHRLKSFLPSTVTLFNSLPSSAVSCSSKRSFTHTIDLHFVKFSFGLL